MAEMIVTGAPGPVLLDDEDYEKIRRWRWRWLNTGAYVVRTLNTTFRGPTSTVMLHRALFDPPNYARIGFRNGNRCDYRRANITINGQPVPALRPSPRRAAREALQAALSKHGLSELELKSLWSLYCLARRSHFRGGRNGGRPRQDATGFGTDVVQDNPV
jgi:hypothetical protein